MSSHPDQPDTCDTSCDNPAAATDVEEGAMATLDDTAAKLVEVDEDLGFGHPQVDDNATLTVSQMVKRCVQFLALNVSRKTPIKREELIRNVMNSQSKHFGEVMRKVEVISNDMFGMKLVKIKLDDNQQPCIANDLDFADKKVVGFIFLSQFPHYMMFM